MITLCTIDSNVVVLLVDLTFQNVLYYFSKIHFRIRHPELFGSGIFVYAESFGGIFLWLRRNKPLNSGRWKPKKHRLEKRHTEVKKTAENGK